MSSGYTKVTYMPIKVMSQMGGCIGCPNSSTPVVQRAVISLPQGGEVTYGDGFDDWRERISKHEQATTTAAGHLDRVFYRPGFVHHQICWPSGKCINWDYLEGNLFPAYQSYRAAPSLDTVLTADNKAKTAFVHDLVEAQTQFRSLVALGEFGESLRMIGMSGFNLINGVKRWKEHVLDKIVKKARPTPAMLEKVKGSMAESWLEFSFGYQPVVNDIRSYFEAVYNRMQNDGIIREGIAIRAKGDDIDVSTVVASRYTGVFLISANVTTIDERIVIYRGYLSGSTLGSIGALDEYKYFGFSLAELAPTIWELTPMSWLADYFFNLGDIITALSYWRTGLKWTNRTVKTAGIIRHSKPKVEVAPFYADYDKGRVSFRPSRFTSKRSSWSRAPYDGNFIPELEFKVPGVFTSWANMASVAHLRNWDRNALRRWDLKRYDAGV